MRDTDATIERRDYTVYLTQQWPGQTKQGYKLFVTVHNDTVDQPGLNVCCEEWAQYHDGYQIHCADNKQLKHTLELLNVPFIQLKEVADA